MCVRENVKRMSILKQVKRQICCTLRGDDGTNNFILNLSLWIWHIVSTSDLWSDGKICANRVQSVFHFKAGNCSQFIIFLLSNFLVLVSLTLALFGVPVCVKSNIKIIQLISSKCVLYFFLILLKSICRKVLRWNPFPLPHTWLTHVTEVKKYRNECKALWYVIWMCHRQRNVCWYNLHVNPHIGSVRPRTSQTPPC